METERFSSDTSTSNSEQQKPQSDESADVIVLGDSRSYIWSANHSGLNREVIRLINNRRIPLFASPPDQDALATAEHVKALARQGSLNVKLMMIDNGVHFGNHTGITLLEGAKREPVLKPVGFCLLAEDYHSQIKRSVGSDVVLCVQPRTFMRSFQTALEQKLKIKAVLHPNLTNQPQQQLRDTRVLIIGVEKVEAMGGPESIRALFPHAAIVFTVPQDAVAITELQANLLSPAGPGAMIISQTKNLEFIPFVAKLYS